MQLIILILIYLLSPALLIYLCQKYPFFNKIGTILLAYFLGLVLAFSGFLPTNSDVVQKWTSELSIPLAIPLLLFSLNVRQWFKLAGRTFVSMLLGIASLLIMVFSGYYFFSDGVPEMWQVGGMLTGVYTGGTPNMAALKTALNVDSNTYIVAHTIDTFLGLAYVTFYITFAQRVLWWFLPAFDVSKHTGNEVTLTEDDDMESYKNIFDRATIFPLLKALGISVLILALGGGVTMLLPKDYTTAGAIMTITTLGILVSLIPSINRIKKTFQLGMYLILVFSIVVASMVSFENIVNTQLNMLFYISYVAFGSIALHFFASKFFKIDADTTIITSTALICSPPFVPLVAGALKNKHIIISGLTVGIIGYAIGNYLGVIVAYTLK